MSLELLHLNAKETDILLEQTKISSQRTLDYKLISIETYIFHRDWKKIIGY